MIFKLVFTASLTFLLASCGINTGLDPVDNVTDPRKTCSADFNVTNQSSNSLVMSVNMYQVIDDARCRLSSAEDSKVLAVGASGSLHVELQCRNCNMTTAYHKVVPANGTGTLSYDNPGSDNLLCTDTGCAPAP